MQIDTRILLIDSNESRRETLLFLLGFIEETVDVCSVEQAASLLRDGGFRSVIACAKAEALIHNNLRQPFLLLDPVDGVDGNAHVIGMIDQPFQYSQLTELLHCCQVYQRSRYEIAPTSPNQTKLFRALVGRSEAISKVRHHISQVAETDATVLVTGESGTGKEVVARNIHHMSGRKEGPFIPVNCGAIPPDLLESELFGHEKGAFTGAISTRKGRFELAQGGTLFLDEIGDMPHPMQVKLLRVLQERCFERVGGSRAINCDVRIVAATHRDLENRIESGDFREDLYYRLNVFPIEMPALREREEDIPLLLNELVSRIEGEGKGTVRFTKRAIESLVQHPWSGNVRELSNLVERMIILCPGGLVDVNDLPSKYRHLDVPEFTPEYPEEMQERDALADLFNPDIPIEIPENTYASALPEEGLNLKDMLSELEVDMIQQALDQGDGVVARAAELLGMRRTTLVEKMRKYGLSKAG